MADRKLPGWMSNDKSSEQTKELSRFHKKNVLEDHLPYLEFPGSVVYSYESHDCSFLSEDLRTGLTPGSAVGFDIEWPPSFIKGKMKKVAMVQLCPSEDKCYLFHISSMAGFPAGLKRLLQDETIRKVGVGIDGDMWKLMSDFDIKMKSTVELGDLANKKLRCLEKWSLDSLVKHLFQKQLLKDKSVRCSRWDDFILAEDQKKYAATDAYAGLIIYKKLEKMDSGGIKLHLDIKEKLMQFSSEIQELAGQIPDKISDTKSAAELVDGMAEKLGALRRLVFGGSSQVTTEEEHDPELCREKTCSTKDTQKPDGKTQRAAFEWGIPGAHDLSHSIVKPVKLSSGDLEPAEAESKPQDYKSASRECVMSLDISEYELDELERQAMQKAMEEESIMEHQAAVDEGADLSYVVESDEELEREMLQCMDEMDEGKCLDSELCGGDQSREQTDTITVKEEEEDDEGIEEEEEEFDPSLPEPNSKQIKCLKTYFGHSSFKPVQWKVIHSVLQERRDNLVVMATGYGKSLCFQFPPVYCGGVGIVISPLIALMEDQVLQLKMSNIPACFLGSAQTDNVFMDLKRGHFRVVYMTPEFCSGNAALIRQLDSDVGITLLAIDEAHCISEWGHDFRSAYRSLGFLKNILPDVPIVALTATASPSIRQDIVKSLNLANPQITCTSFDRPNLFLDVRRKSGDVVKDLKHFLIRKTPLDHEFEGSTIVYCPSRKLTETVSAELTKLGVTCGAYHAGMGVKSRRETHHKFVRDEIQCVVATIAFGMGINKPDIRKVIHYGAPKEMESYYQEIGRAGRDGLPSTCHVVWSSSDMVLNRHLLSSVKSEKFRGYKLKMMAKMEQYLNSCKCRRKLILSHFEDRQLRKVTSGIMGTSKCCDNCRSGSVYSSDVEDSEPSLQDFGKEAHQLMGAVSALGGKFGTSVPILFLRGSHSQRLPDRFRKHCLFGSGKNIPDTWWKALARQLISEQYMKEDSGQNRFATICSLTPKGKTWLSKASSGTQQTLLLPPNSDLYARIVNVPKSHQMSSPTTSFSSARQPTVALQKSPASRFSPADSRKCPSTVSSATTRPQISLSLQHPSNVSLPSHAPPVSPRDLELQGVLYSKLVAGRQKLATEKDIPPAVMATNKILLDMAKIRPTTVENLKMVDGVSEAKSSMLAPLLEIVSKFCCSNGLQVNMLSSTPSCPERVNSGVRPACAALSDSVDITYRLFQKEKMSLTKVSNSRGLPLAVVGSHLLQAVKAGCPLDMDRAGLTAHTRRVITNIITDPPINSDVSNFKAIRNLVPEEIDTFLISLTVALLQKEGDCGPERAACSGLKPSPTPCSKQLEWIETKEKPVKKKTSRPHSSETSVKMDDLEIEDELLSEIPMPEVEVSMSPRDTAASFGSECDAAPRAMKNNLAVSMASWNQEQLDEDTQELFRDSPPKVCAAAILVGKGKKKVRLRSHGGSAVILPFLHQLCFFYHIK
uniref:DNA 3'-5' helicase n=1 Tax=Lepisosteus oculatus TaxID=7918 RepID=W5MXW8_LEPOC